MSCFLCLVAGRLAKRLLWDCGAGRLLQQQGAWRKSSISLSNFRDAGYFLNCWEVAVVGWTPPVNYEPVRTGLIWALPNELMKRMSEAGDLFPWQNVPGELQGSHVKTTEINTAFSSGHRSAGILFAEASSPVSAASTVTERLVRKVVWCICGQCCGLKINCLGFCCLLNFFLLSKDVPFCPWWTYTRLF